MATLRIRFAEVRDRSVAPPYRRKSVGAGADDDADTHRVFIKRAEEAVEHRVDLTVVTTVEPGDTIRIKERYF